MIEWIAAVQREALEWEALEWEALEWEALEWEALEWEALEWEMSGLKAETEWIAEEALELPGEEEF